MFVNIKTCNQNIIRYIFLLICLIFGFTYTDFITIVYSKQCSYKFCFLLTRKYTRLLIAGMCVRQSVSIGIKMSNVRWRRINTVARILSEPGNCLGRDQNCLAAGVQDGSRLWYLFTKYQGLCICLELFLYIPTSNSMPLSKKYYIYYYLLRVDFCSVVGK